MLLSPCYHSPILPPKTLANTSPSFFTTHKTLTLQNPEKPSKSLIKCSSTGNRTRSRAENVPKSAIQRIAEKLRSLGIVEEKAREKVPNPEEKSAGEIFIPLPDKIAKYRVGHTIDTSWSTPENPVPEPGSGTAIVRYNELNKMMGRQKRLEAKTKKKENEKEKVAPSLAELKLSQQELRRLRTIGIGLRKKLKIGKAGITEGIVNGIHERWRNTEVVKIVCDDLCRLNMKRTHELLERKTGGLVVWRSGSKIILYRGVDYKYPYFFSDKTSINESTPKALPDPNVENEELDGVEGNVPPVDNAKPPQPSPSYKNTQSTLIRGVGSPDKLRFQLPGEAELVEEADRLLEGLGPRFTDWWGYDPQPIDADLLPAVVPGYRRPFRLLPFGVQPKLTNDEMTTLRRLGRPLPCHFVLGRNRKLQGLAAATVKLWEKCEIAKIAVKRGVQNTNSELMAEELKWLTGGTLLARDREFIVLYRGKDFLPHAVSSAIEERRKQGVLVENQKTEELKLMNTQENSKDDTDCDSEDEFGNSDDQKAIMSSEQKELRPAEAAIRRTSIKLSMALEKKDKAEKLLAELEKKEIEQQPELDKEGITEEERYMLRKVGLRMKAFLLLGRRGVFAGTVENMHLHWKYRELVKIISKEKSIGAVHQEARTLEAESGGILVAVERVNKGHAIIMYRGKNYERPETLRPKTLLTKREAMKRSLEAQRRQSLKLHVLELAKKVDSLKSQLDKDKDTMQSVDKSRMPQVQEEMDDEQPVKHKESDTEPKSEYSGIVTSDEGTVEAREEEGTDSTSIESNGPMDSTAETRPLTELDKLINFPSTSNGNAIRKIEFDSSTKSGDEEIQQEGMSDSAAVHTEYYLSDNEPTDSPLVLAVKNSEPSVATENRSNGMASRAVYLSNRDRLLLRKQALKMKKRPVLAVGRSNIVTGVAKAINAHFEKHPLAIVNVKGRAKGTSVQEVVLKLQEATGAVLVSQEPSKVILYRGWGAEEDEYSHCRKKNRRDVSKTLFGKDVEHRPAVSPELLAAIRLECGLEGCEEEEEESLS